MARPPDAHSAEIPSQSTEAQASAGQIAQLAALIRREHVRAIFPESSINPKLAQALADVAERRVRAVDLERVAQERPQVDKSAAAEGAAPEA